MIKSTMPKRTNNPIEFISLEDLFVKPKHLLSQEDYKYWEDKIKKLTLKLEKVILKVNQIYGEELKIEFTPKVQKMKALSFHQVKRKDVEDCYEFWFDNYQNDSNFNKVTKLAKELWRDL